MTWNHGLNFVFANFTLLLAIGATMDVRNPPKKSWTWVSYTPAFYHLQLLHIRKENHFILSLVYTLYNHFNYMCESSTIWSHTHTHTFLQNTKRKRVSKETKIVRNFQCSTRGCVHERLTIKTLNVVD